MIYTLIDFYLSNNNYDNVALGTFDGVHLGHQKVIKSMPLGDKNLVISFDTFEKPIINVSEKLNDIQFINSNLDVLSINLEGKYRETSPLDFVEFLKKLKIKNIFVGKDFKFGYNREGSIKYLKKHFKVQIVEFYEVDNQKVSSSQIKEELRKGNISKVNFYLNRNYYVKGVVERGDQIGRLIDFPTINLTTNSLLPKNGVYKTHTDVNGKQYLSITNVGVRPTISGKNQTIETYIVNDFCEEIYGEIVKVEFNEFIREERKFNNIEELKGQIRKDVESLEE